MFTSVARRAFPKPEHDSPESVRDHANPCEVFTFEEGIEENKSQTPSSPPIDLVPFTVAVVGRIQEQIFDRPLLCLADTGADSTWINSEVLPKGANGTTVSRLTGKTMAGTFTSTQAVRLREIALPEFHRNRVIDRINARVFHADCRYDIILGRDVLRMLKLNVDFGDNIMTWDGATVSMKPKPQKQSLKQHSIHQDDLEDLELTEEEELLLDLLEDELDDCSCDEGFAVTAEDAREKAAAEAGYRSSTDSTIEIRTSQHGRSRQSMSPFNRRTTKRSIEAIG